MTSFPSEQNTPESIEAMILAAGNFVEVRRHMRPAVVEEAKATITCHNAWRRGGVLATVVLCLIILLAFVTHNPLTKSNAGIAVPSKQANSDALDASDWSWGMVQMFQRLQADRIRAFRGEP